MWCTTWSRWSPDHPVFTVLESFTAARDAGGGSSRTIALAGHRLRFLRRFMARTYSNAALTERGVNDVDLD